jgi:hypothetical protein
MTMEGIDPSSRNFARDGEGKALVFLRAEG